MGQVEYPVGLIKKTSRCLGGDYRGKIMVNKLFDRKFERIDKFEKRLIIRQYRLIPLPLKFKILK